MNLEYFISKKIISDGSSSKRFTKPIIKISIAAIALSLIVMIVAVSIISGFQEEVRNKVIGFGGHIQITNYDSQSTYEASPLSTNQDFYPSMDSVPGIKHVQVYATKAGIIKTKEEIFGVVVKGVGEDFDWDFFNEKLVEGSTFNISKDKKENNLLISKYIADKMKLKVDDKIFLYFVQSNGQLRPKNFKITGLYQTGLEQFDHLFVISDIAHIQKRNNWESDQVGGFEILIDDYEDLHTLDEYVYENIGYELFSTNILEQYPDIFNWLELLDYNVNIILILMVIVAVINIVSALLILILERTNMIGLLKALGLSNWRVRKIFLHNAIHLILKGLFWGNVIALVLCYVQKYFSIIKLPEESYYVSVVPIKLNIIHILMINGGTLLICVLMLLIPSYIITKISPVKAIRYD